MGYANIECIIYNLSFVNTYIFYDSNLTSLIAEYEGINLRRINALFVEFLMEVKGRLVELGKIKDV